MTRSSADSVSRSVYGKRSFGASPPVFLSLVFFFMAAMPVMAAKHVIGYTTISFARAPVWIANDLRLYEKNGVDAEVVFLRGGTIGTQALIGGTVGFIASSGSAAVEAILSGADLVILAGYSNLLDQMLVTKKEIKTPAQLKGAKIALNSLSGGSILAVKIILSALGLDPDKDASYLALGDPASRFSALKAGIVDATVLTTPFNSIAKRAGYNVFDDMPALKNIDYPSDSLISTREFIRKEPVVTERVIKSISEAIQFYKNNKAQSLAILAKYLRGLSSEDLEEAYPRYFYGFREKPYPSVKGVQTVLQWSKHPKAKDADPARFIERKFVESLDKPLAK
jgi:ABC-type nitrate/sulfonate/bicarbonate transport system substrate-binding protein